MKKKRNPLFYLGWLGLVGLVGIFCGASILASFLPFFFFFVYRNMTPDELFWDNARKAGLRAVMVYLTLHCLAALTLFTRGVIYGWRELPVLKDGMITMPATQYAQFELVVAFFLGSFVVTLCTFVFTLMIFHYREKKLLEQEGLSC